jgi:UDP-N-acetyl-D-glucosamine dehydrogenase
LYDESVTTMTPETTAPSVGAQPTRRARYREVAIVGAGYVGIPLAHVFAEAGVGSVLLDIDVTRVRAINRGESYIEDVSSEALAPLVEQELVAATTDYDALRQTDAVVVALPTPLTPNREPDLSIVMSAVTKIAERLRPGHLIVLESTTYPGTTRDEVLPVLEQISGLQVGKDFFLAFSPERVDPGRTDWTTRTTPKIVGGVTEACTERAVALYERALETVIPVSSPEAAELTKLLENIFRSVNIALVNELAQLCDRMGVDVWEVVDAAATKPFGFMSFKPGPGLGGHCLPVDPFYLSWKARQYDFYTEFIELAGKINENMPYFCLEKVTRALNSHEKAIKGSKILLVGVSYKADVGDLRESPALKLVELLREQGGDVAYHDPHVPELREHGLVSTDLDGALEAADCVAVVTAHSGIDYGRLAERSRLLVDFRNATGRNGTANGRVWKL